MTDTRHTQPRCAICRWPYRPDGCTPGSCCFRPHEGTDEYTANALRLTAYGRLRIAGNPTPTLEDVDAELAPKGLPVVELTMPMWIGSWRDIGGDVWRRLLLAEYPISPFIWQCQVERRVNGTWDATRQGYPPADDRGCYGHPTPEAAQAACEAAIVAAWSNR
jgi:hypothetical protein